MRVVLTAAAIAELDRATRWYDNQAPGLAALFLDEYAALVARLADNPLQFPAIRGACAPRSLSPLSLWPIFPLAGPSG